MDRSKLNLIRKAEYSIFYISSFVRLKNEVKKHYVIVNFENVNKKQKSS